MHSSVAGVPFRDRKRTTEHRDALLLARLRPMFSSLRILYLSDWALTDRALSTLSQLRLLEELGLSSVRSVSSEGLKMLTGLPHLKAIELQGIPQWRLLDMQVTLLCLPEATVLSPDDELDSAEVCWTHQCVQSC